MLFLLGAVAWKLDESSQNMQPTFTRINSPTSYNSQNSSESFPTTSSSPEAAADPSTPLGSAVLNDALVAYANASKGGVSKDAGVAAVEDVVRTFSPQITYRNFTTSDIQTDQDTSAERALSYRSDLQTAFAPLLLNKEFELTIFAHYVDSKDPGDLQKLRSAAVNYRSAIMNASKVIVPEDAAPAHVAVLNALGRFAATLDTMVDNAKDPVASVALLKTYTAAQEGVLASFNSIGAYAAQKTL